MIRRGRHYQGVEDRALDQLGRGVDGDGDEQTGDRDTGRESG
jgi:hypothetical protein